MLGTLRSKLFVAMLILGVLPLVLTGIISYRIASHGAVEEAKQKLRNLPLTAGGRIESMMYFLSNDIQTAAHLPLFRATRDQDQMAAFVQQKIRLHPGLAWLAASDAHGRLMAASDPEKVGTDVSREGWFRNARVVSFEAWQQADKAVWMSDALPSKFAAGQPIVCLNTPIYDYAERFAGTIHYEVALAFLARALKGVQLGQRGSVMLVKGDGTVLADQDGVVFEQKRSASTLDAFRRAKAGEAGIVKERDLSGAEAFISYTPLQGFLHYPGLGWSILATQPVEEVYAPSLALSRLHAWIGGIGVLLILIGGFFLLDRGVSRPIAALAARATAIGRGDLNTPIPQVSGTEIGLLARSLDQMVRDLKANEQARRETEAQLLQAGKLASIGELAAGVAHELNQPLMVIRALSQSLLVDPALSADREKDLALIEKNTERMARIISHLRSFSRQSQMERQPVDLQEVLENALALVRDPLDAASIEVRRAYARPLPTIVGDANQLEQAFLNLITNARDAMEPQGGGTLSVTTRARGPDGNGDGPTTVEVVIADTGAGIPPEHLGRIFDPFFTTKAPGRGTGLGLSICYGIVRDHGGTVHVESRPGEGTRFTLVFPSVAPPPLDPGRVSEPAATGSAAREAVA
ncbi:MAG: HAMP domain-containing protein [Deltaproteobacteria bacterium]|nr:HAMP domain-containing protein [Deltaproteobacteria bacterium]